MISLTFLWKNGTNIANGKFPLLLYNLKEKMNKGKSKGKLTSYKFSIFNS